MKSHPRRRIHALSMRNNTMEQNNGFIHNDDIVAGVKWAEQRLTGARGQSLLPGEMHCWGRRWAGRAPAPTPDTVAALV